MENKSTLWKSLKRVSVTAIFDNLEDEEFLKIEGLKNRNVKRYYYQKLNKSFTCSVQAHMKLITNLYHFPEFNPYAVITVSNDYDIKVWNIFSYRLMCTLKGHVNTISTLSYVGNNKLASSEWGENETLRVWDLMNLVIGEEIEPFHTKHGLNVTCIYDLSSYQKGNIFLGSIEEPLRLYNYESGEILKTYDKKKTKFCQNIIELKYLGEEIILFTSNKTFKVFDYSKEKVTKEIKAHKERILSIVHFTKEGKNFLVSSGWDFVIKLWDIDCFSELGSLQVFESQIRRLIVVPGDALLAVGQEKITLVIKLFEESCNLKTLSEVTLDIRCYFLVHIPILSEKLINKNCQNRVFVVASQGNELKSLCLKY